jgi:hypothetical protein
MDVDHKHASVLCMITVLYRVKINELSDFRHLFNKK